MFVEQCERLLGLVDVLGASSCRVDKFGRDAVNGPTYQGSPAGASEFLQPYQLSPIKTV